MKATYSTLHAIWVSRKNAAKTCESIYFALDEGVSRNTNIDIDGLKPMIWMLMIDLIPEHRKN